MAEAAGLLVKLHGDGAEVARTMRALHFGKVEAQPILTSPVSSLLHPSQDR